MKLGFITSILDGWSYEEMMDTAAQMGFTCAEVACWPAGKAERRYAGVSHAFFVISSPLGFSGSAF